MLTMIQQRTITESLGIRGWQHLDAVLLASLATEAPLLLVGPHGTAKSLLVERIAKALELEMRHYNASLLNYDDLVGIPMPDESGTQLNFIKTPGTIWNTGFVFFDEISRCRADLQNKLFPIIHERRVIGIGLNALKHRWAAMNPPAPEDPNITGNSASYYLGSEPLDPALVDRFPFVINVPDWGNLSKADRMALVNSKTSTETIAFEPGALISLVERCQAHLADVEDAFQDWLGDYILSVMDLLEQGGLSQSGRRAEMLARSVIAIHAARMVLEGDEAAPADSAETAIVYGIPQTATDVPPTIVKLIALHRQAWEITQYLEDDKWRQVMSEYDMAQRVALADQLDFSDEELSRLITQTISTEDSDPRQIGLATAMFLAFKDRRNLDASAFEPLAQLASHILAPRKLNRTEGLDSNEAKVWKGIEEWINNQYNRQDSMIFRLERNFLLYGYPRFWLTTSWGDAIKTFREDLKLFGVED